jgi:hypothetical protein
MDQPFLQVQMVERQQLCLDILRVVYESEYPITLETISSQIYQSTTVNFSSLVRQLVCIGYLKIQIRDGNPNYCKPSSLQPRLPLPYCRIFD